jgi:membrane-bound lytic murein transglycosylase D
LEGIYSRSCGESDKKEQAMKWSYVNRVFLLSCVFLCSGCGILETPLIRKADTPAENREIEEAVPEDSDIKNRSVGAISSPNDQGMRGTETVATEDDPPYGAEEDIDMSTESSASTYHPTDQELIDTALEYYQAANKFWEQGELDHAIGALDKAYSNTLEINGDNPETLQSKEDLRITISRRIIEVYSSRFTVANGSYTEIPLDMNEYVEKAIALFKGDQRKFFLDSYARSGRYRPMIVKELKKAGLPEELSWLPLIESGFKMRALSRSRALGMWQFMASTGYKFGLKRDNWIDERMDPEKSTRAAIAYLTELHHIFGDWTTALAAYNWGEGRVLKCISTQKIDYLDNFWDLYRKLPKETAFFVPKFLAVLHILNDPEKHGFELPPLEKKLRYEKVTINKQLQIKTIAEVLDLDSGQLKDLNPELRQDLTPKTTYELKVPVGKGKVLMARIKDLPAYTPPVAIYVEHRVRSGESLSVIAERYRTSVRSIMEMNGLRNRDYLRVGWKLKIPTGRVSSYYATGQGGQTDYVVRKGDSLWKIARRYNTTVNALTSLNNLKSTTLQIGQVLRISASFASSGPANTREYIVKKGDSPYLIAKTHHMDLYEFLRLNNLTAQSTIFPGQILLVVAD